MPRSSATWMFRVAFSTYKNDLQALPVLDSVSPQVTVSSLHLIYSPNDCLKKRNCSYRRYWKKRMRHNACCDLVSTKSMSRPEGAILCILVLENWLQRLASGLEGRRYPCPGMHYFYNYSLKPSLQCISRRKT